MEFSIIKNKKETDDILPNDKFSISKSHANPSIKNVGIAEK